MHTQQISSGSRSAVACATSIQAFDARARSKLAYTAAVLQRGGVLAIGECSIQPTVPFICQCPSAGSFNCQWHREWWLYDIDGFNLLISLSHFEKALLRSAVKLQTAHGSVAAFSQSVTVAVMHNKQHQWCSSC
eukprot:12894-Heterococcus_DN1.PRE.2